MSTPKPYAGTSRDRLTELINSVNPYPRTEGVDFNFGAPVLDTGPRGQNSSVMMMPVPGTLYREPERIYYNRLDLAVLGLLPEGFLRPVVIPSAPFWIRNHLDEINDALGLNLRPDEVFNDHYTTLQSSYILRVNGNNSHAWITSQYEFAAVVEDNDPDLQFHPEVDALYQHDLLTPLLRIPVEARGFSPSPFVRPPLSFQDELDALQPKDKTSPLLTIPVEARGFTPSKRALGLVAEFDGIQPKDLTQPLLRVPVEARGFTPSESVKPPLQFHPELDAIQPKDLTAPLIRIPVEARGFTKFVWTPPPSDLEFFPEFDALYPVDLTAPLIRVPVEARGFSPVVLPE